MGHTFLLYKDDIDQYLYDYLIDLIQVNMYLGHKNNRQIHQFVLSSLIAGSVRLGRLYIWICLFDLGTNLAHKLY